MTESLFILFGVFTIASALGVIVSKNPVYSSFFLITTFFCLAGLYVLWGATFIAVVQVLIYTGAIVVLFVFVVMLLSTGKRQPSHSSGWLALIVVGSSVWLLSLVLLRILNRATFHRASAELSSNNITSLSRLLFSEYLWPFEVLSLFLLATIVAVYTLASRHRGDST
jgi:NADH-quinone oxidoreductase subunit J